MDINFCCARLKTEISSSAVSCEGHDVSNLLASDTVLKDKGFLAEGFTKPPVSIVLKFFCEIDINHILVWTELGSQKSNGLELLVASEIQGLKSGDYTKRYSSLENSKTYCKIGSCKLKNETGVVFQKYNCRATTKVPVHFIMKYFNSSAANAMKKASILEIKIFSTANSSVPAIKKIEVWGKPSRSCPESVRCDMFKLWNFRICNTALPSEKESGLSTRQNNLKDCSPSCSDISNADVPEEFLDPITLSVMALPMTLPSGKTVDISTLEKFEAEESCWGRNPSDPYTGVPYTQTVFPVPDPALKSRIDQFLMENGHMDGLKGVGRTTGRGSRINVDTLSSNVKKTDPVSEGHQTDGLYPSVSQDKSSNSCVPVPDNQKCFPLESEKTPEVREFAGYAVKERGVGTKGSSLHHSVSVSDAKAPNCFASKRKYTSGLTSLSGALAKVSRSSCTINHEEDVEDSLDVAMQSVLTGLPSFVKGPGESSHAENASTKVLGCCCCPSREYLFLLPCQHNLCRSCLVAKSSGHEGAMECEVCKTSFSSSDVVRHHLP